ncbi:hypothetical protein A2U01_0108696, partial [Trifolium medium]|nr:hypothetical protein [Trifolium medium]
VNCPSAFITNTASSSHAGPSTSASWHPDSGASFHAPMMPVTFSN